MMVVMSVSFCRLGRCARAAGGLFCGWLSLGFCLFVGFELAHGRPVQFQPIGVVDDAIEDGVGESRVAESASPAVLQYASGKR